MTRIREEEEVSNPDQTSYYHCWVGIVASVPLLSNSLRSRSCCLVGNKSDSSGKYYSSPVPPSCTAVNNIPCTFIVKV